MTTERARTRWSKDAVRGVAWATGAAAFLASVAAIAVVPKPAAADAPDASTTPTGTTRRQVIERHVTRRIVVITPTEPSTPVTVAQAPTAAGVAAPAPQAPVTSSGGS